MWQIHQNWFVRDCERGSCELIQPSIVLQNWGMGDSATPTMQMLYVAEGNVIVSVQWSEWQLASCGVMVTSWSNVTRQSLSSALSCCTMNWSVSFSRGKLSFMLPLGVCVHGGGTETGAAYNSVLASSTNTPPLPPVDGSTDGDGCPSLLIGLGQCLDLCHGSHLTLCDGDLQGSKLFHSKVWTVVIYHHSRYIWNAQAGVTSVVSVQWAS